MNFHTDLQSRLTCLVQNFNASRHLQHMRTAAKVLCKALEKSGYQGPVVQSVVSLTSSLRVISLTVLADSIYNILIFFAEKM